MAEAYVGREEPGQDDVVMWTPDNSVDLSRTGQIEFPCDLLCTTEQDYENKLLSLQLHHNSIAFLPPSIKNFAALIILDMSNCGLSQIASEICELKSLKTLIIKNNLLDDDSLPKDMKPLHSLRSINMGGNLIESFPVQFLEMPMLERLLLGSNKIRDIPPAIDNLTRLETLNIGDNLLTSVPKEVGSLHRLSNLNLACNRISALPRTLIHLKNLKSLSLHNNKLSTLPPEIVSINLVELSLRNNPLVVKFVEDMTFEPPSLMELAGRVIKLRNVPYSEEDLPHIAHQYLISANKCVNPKCKGVFFASKVEHVKFVDFCGKYRLPLMQYLCSPHCSPSKPHYAGNTSDSESDDDMRAARARIRRVLLG